MRVVKGARILVLVVLAGTVAGCGLPRSGPSKREIYSGSVQRQGNAFVVSVNDRVTRATAVTPELGFSPAFLNARQLGSDTIRPGDVLAMTVYENVEQGLLSVGAPGGGSGGTPLTEVQVDGTGHIFIPYAGRIRAAGNTPEELRRIITRKLDPQTPDPQIMVARAAGDGSTISIVGGVAGQGVYPIERSTRTLTAMIARAGGIGPAMESETTKVTVIRGKERGTVWLEDLFQEPDLDIALRPGDRIIVEQDTRAFTAMGATGAQTRVPFDSPDLSALEAIAQVGGLNSNLADPTGVFVLRDEPAPVANAVLGRDDLIGLQRMVYVLDLTETNGMFEARDFLIRDGDTVYVTEAPYVQWIKVLGALTGSITSVNSATQLASQ
ncbi:sugar ABC transporter substrate-binding protein [Maritimibacter sp. 55A14]|uniref:polysaccharide biosynthesis/export family protein n=1 Tax=Maritimibacter sp. 55A14 TaxID=2174844 RepID=UPI000D6201CE|nr:polysaccharide biosynthesis/export family protein [Maritimibacter sp. 55A14]PWE33288.1 sugar ABC transporter substrate-binding protein [Maritimibacter sp. 55A14]